MAEILEKARQDAELLLTKGYVSLESGYSKIGETGYVVAALTKMPYCRKEMVEWWFAYGLSPQEHTQIYKLWHPVDHVYGAWDDKWSPGNYIGASHIVDETLGRKPPVYKLRIHFQDPSTLFDETKLASADSTAVVAFIFDREQNIRLGVMTHFVRNTEMGC